MSSSTKKRSAQHGRDDAANDVPHNTAKKPKKSISSSDDGSAAAAAPVKPVYQKIKAGRTLGYPITVTQGGTNNKISQHDAILLNCNDENPEEYLAKFAHDDKVKIKWMIAGYSDFVAVQTIQLKLIDAAPPTRKAAADSGLMLIDGYDSVFSEVIPQPVTSNMAIKTEDIDTDTEESIQVKKGPTPQPVNNRNVTIKTEDIDTDDEATNQDKNGPVPEPVASSMTINTYEIDTDTDEVEVFGTDTLRDRLQAIVDQSDLNGDALYQYDVRKRLEKWFGCDLTKHQYDIYYALNEQLEKRFGQIPSWLVEGAIVEVKKLRRKGSIKSVPDPNMGNIISVEFDEMTTISTNFWHLNFVPPQVNDNVAVFAGKYRGTEGTLVAVTGENAVVNVSWKEEITFELAKLCKIGKGYSPLRHCSNCKASKYASAFSEEEKRRETPCCNDCVCLLFLRCSTCNVLKRRLDCFKKNSVRCIECEVKLVCSTCKVSKSAGLFSESQKSRGEAACCKECEVVLVCSKCKVSKSAGLFNRKSSICKECDVLVCSSCQILKRVPSNFIKAESKRGEDAVCNKCRASLVCSACKVLKNKSNHFTKAELKRGEDAVCNKCRASLVCSACKVLKNKSNHFTKAESKRGEDAVCNQCAEAETPLVCSACKVLKNKSNHFTKAERKKGEDAVCIACCIEGDVLLWCSTCKSSNKETICLIDDDEEEKSEKVSFREVQYPPYTPLGLLMVSFSGRVVIKGYASDEARQKPNKPGVGAIIVAANGTLIPQNANFNKVLELLRKLLMNGPPLTLIFAEEPDFMLLFENNIIPRYEAAIKANEAMENAKDNDASSSQCVIS